MSSYLDFWIDFWKKISDFLQTSMIDNNVSLWMILIGALVLGIILSFLFHSGG